MFLKRLSNSKRETYRQCGFKYLLEYEEKIPDKGGNIGALQFGSYIHAIFEEGVKAKSLAELEKIADKLRKEYTFDNSYNGKIKTCLKNFLRLNSSLQETVGIELNFTVPVLEDLDYQVIIDRVIKAKTGEYLVIDYKTSKDEKTKVELFSDNQLRGYVYAYSKKFGVPVEKIKACHYYPLTDTLVPISYTSGQIAGYIRELEKDIWRIRKAKKDDLAPRENKYCGNCGKRYYCPKFVSPQDSKHRIDEALEQKRNSANNQKDKHNEGGATVLPPSLHPS